jgi:hypothetical protein
VYVARAVELDRLVAVKRAHPHLFEEPGSREALLSEARLAARIRHANVASVHDVEETDDELFLVMDYVEGTSLSELLETARLVDGPLAPRVALRILLDAAQGLAAVHDLVGDDGQPFGMVHRDVSPQNVLVGRDGTSRIADFGLARLSASRDASRTTGTLEGKLAYLAPELLEGRRYTPRSDLFALGVVAWEALSGRRLFRGENDADTLRRVMRTEIPSLAHAVPELGRSLDGILVRALANDPAARYPSVRTFAAELEARAVEAGLLGTSAEVAAALEQLLGDQLARRRAAVRSALLGGRGGDLTGRVPEGTASVHATLVAASEGRVFDGVTAADADATMPRFSESSGPSSAPEEDVTLAARSSGDVAALATPSGPEPGLEEHVDPDATLVDVDRTLPLGGRVSWLEGVRERWGAHPLARRARRLGPGGAAAVLVVGIALGALLARGCDTRDATTGDRPKVERSP